MIMKIIILILCFIPQEDQMQMTIKDQNVFQNLQIKNQIMI